MRICFVTNNSILKIRENLFLEEIKARYGEVQFCLETENPDIYIIDSINAGYADYLFRRYRKPTYIIGFTVLSKNLQVYLREVKDASQD